MLRQYSHITGFLQHSKTYQQISPSLTPHSSHSSPHNLHHQHIHHFSTKQMVNFHIDSQNEQIKILVLYQFVAVLILNDLYQQDVLNYHVIDILLISLKVFVVVLVLSTFFRYLSVEIVIFFIFIEIIQCGWVFEFVFGVGLLGFFFMLGLGNWIQYSDIVQKIHIYNGDQQSYYNNIHQMLARTFQMLSRMPKMLPISSVYNPRYSFTSTTPPSQAQLLQMVEAKVFEILKSAAKCNQSQLSKTATFQQLGFDSLDAVELVVAMEQNFAIDIPNEQAQKIQTVQAAINTFFRHMNQKINKQEKQA